MELISTLQCTNDIQTGHHECSNWKSFAQWCFFCSSSVFDFSPPEDTHCHWLRVRSYICLCFYCFRQIGTYDLTDRAYEKFEQLLHDLVWQYQNVKNNWFFIDPICFPFGNLLLLLLVDLKNGRHFIHFHFLFHFYYIYTNIFIFI